MSLGERIALARKQAGLSQEQLGEKLGGSRQAVSKWRRGRPQPGQNWSSPLTMALQPGHRSGAAFRAASSPSSSQSEDTPSSRHIWAT